MKGYENIVIVYLRESVINVRKKETRVCGLRCFFFLQGNITAIKYISKKRIELTRNLLFELKHVSVSLLPPVLGDFLINNGSVAFWETQRGREVAED